MTKRDQRAAGAAAPRDRFAVFPTEQTVEIARLNDEFRTHLKAGRVFITRGIQQFGADAWPAIFELIRNFDAFGNGNDPYGEHDFGTIEYAGQKLFWKIDYYDHSMTAGSADPSDPKQTCRVMTVMLPSEY